MSHLRHCFFENLRGISCLKEWLISISPTKIPMKTLGKTWKLTISKTPNKDWSKYYLETCPLEIQPIKLD